MLKEESYDNIRAIHFRDFNPRPFRHNLRSNARVILEEMHARLKLSPVPSL